jgi:hypothetical protein
VFTVTRFVCDRRVIRVRSKERSCEEVVIMMIVIITATAYSLSVSYQVNVCIILNCPSFSNAEHATWVLGILVKCREASLPHRTWKAEVAIFLVERRDSYHRRGVCVKKKKEREGSEAFIRKISARAFCSEQES